MNSSVFRPPEYFVRKSREILDVLLCKVSQQHNGRNNVTIQESWKYLGRNVKNKL